MKVSRKFVEDFELVVKHYACPADEVELMKECARRDIEAATLSFARMAAEIRPKGDDITARIREQLKMPERKAA